MVKEITKIRILTQLIILCLAMALINSSLAAQTEKSVTVLVLPFQVNASEDMTYLRNQIPAVLTKHLENDGATIAELKPQDLEQLQQAPVNLDQLRELANRYNASRVIQGSFTLIGDTFSIDSHLTEPLTNKAPMGFSIQGHTMENLLNVLQNLAQQIGRKLFQRETVAEVHIKGNQRIESDAILREIKTKPGSIYKQAYLSNDLKAIFSMGYFDDLRVTAESSPAGKIITFHVKEKSTIRRIKTKGNHRFDDKEIKENLTINTGSILNIFKIRSNLDQIEALYKEKNYHNVRVNYEIHPLENNQADLVFMIEEGGKVYVQSIKFEGNKDFDAKRLKKEIKTSKKGFWYWLTSSGDLDKEKLNQDIAALNAFYHNQGYIQARVAEPQIDIQDDGIYITIKIEEGSRFKVGTIDFNGDLIIPKEELITKVKINKETYFNREIMRNDVLTLTDLYGDRGYAYADVTPKIKQNSDKLLVDINFNIKKNQEVFFENIIINGNSRTRDKVIRRQLHVHESERYNQSALKRSVRNLFSLDYFEDIQVEHLKGSADNKMSLKIVVKEKTTGLFSFGAGYSSVENIFFVGSITERNLFGRGQILKLEANIGSATTRYDLSFTEPWMFDIPLSGTINVYNQEKEVTTYVADSQGGRIIIGYRIFDYTRLYWNYNYDITDITLDSNKGDEALDSIKELKGKNITSSTGLSLLYDSRDHRFNPTEGSKHRLAFQHAGLGGDISFNKITLETGWYIPLYKSLIGLVHAKTGYIYQPDAEKKLPDYQKFYLGGINSLRGFKVREIHLTEKNDLGLDSEMGGDYMAQFNLELIFPISKEMGLMGVVFYDTGNVYESGIDLGNMRESVGYGFRWYSPIAPIRLEYGHILNPLPHEDDGNWSFTMGAAF